MSQRKFALPLAAAFAMLAPVLATAHAQSPSTGSGQAFPNRPVRIIVPLAPGGGMDTVARGLGARLSDVFGQTVVVDNRPGAGSVVALEILTNAVPDGHTLMGISSTTIIHPLLYKSRFDIRRDVAHISQVTAQGYVMVVHPTIPAKTVLEFVKHAKANPDRLNFASSGIGSPIHMSGELFQVMTGTKMIHVPYKGMGAAYTDLVGGRIEVGFPTIISSIPHVKAGRLRALAVTTPKRVPAVADVPTFAEAGVKGVVVENWYGLIAPKATPKPVIDRIAKEVAGAMQTPEVQKRLVAEGSEAVGSSPAEFAAHVRAEHEKWSRVIKTAGIKGE